MSEVSDKPPRPSKSLRPGMPRFLATVMVDPMFLVITVVSAIAEGITKALISWWGKRAEKRAVKKAAKKGKK